MATQTEIENSKFLKVQKLNSELRELLCPTHSGLWTLGNVDLLSKKAISFCGSRKASEKGIQTARECAAEAVKLGVGTISGNAAGVDVNVHAATLESGGWSIFVLAEGIHNFRIKRAYAEFWDWDRCLVVSQYNPDDRWQVWRAMERNNLIIALGIAMIVVEAGETGGTREAARQAQKAGKPLFAVTYENAVPGNDAILSDGATILGREKSTRKPNIRKVLNSAEKARIQTGSAFGQAHQSLPL